jgi:hypothetical protein
LIYVFGGGCNGGTNRQGNTVGTILDDQFLTKGYLVATNSLNVFANNCDDMLASEAMMMTREHAIKTFGVPDFTIGWGCSGGAYQVDQIADNYPGLMDGIVPICNSVDTYRTGQTALDLALLDRWLHSAAASGLSASQKVAIVGTALGSLPPSSMEQKRDSATTCAPVVPKDEVFDPQANPKGVRCSMYDHQVNTLGRDPQTGFARRTVDNVGVQYGLGALNSGALTKAQFLDLNENIGGYDNNGMFSSQRALGDPKALELAYSRGRVLNGGGGLRNIPILELRFYTDGDAAATHHKGAALAFLSRLLRGTGRRDNYVFLLESQDGGPYKAAFLGGDELSHYGLQKMDEWLTNLRATIDGTKIERIVRAKPSDLVDGCWDHQGNRINEPLTFYGGRCNALYPTYPSPRMVAGEPAAQDVLKCQLRPVTASDYKVTYSAGELARLKGIFPNGVCDWSKPGVGQVPISGTWLSN